jgi:hypothetical protein
MPVRYPVDRILSSRLLGLLDLNLDSRSCAIDDASPPLSCDSAEVADAIASSFVRNPDNDREFVGTWTEVAHWPLLEVVCFETDFVEAFAVFVIFRTHLLSVWIAPILRWLISQMQKTLIASTLAFVAKSLVVQIEDAAASFDVHPLPNFVAHFITYM